MSKNQLISQPRKIQIADGYPYLGERNISYSWTRWNMYAQITVDFNRRF